MEPPAIVELAFHSATEVLGATTNTVIKFDALTEKYALLADIEHVDLQNVLAQVGINVSLGDFDFSIQKVGLSHATELSVLSRAGYAWRWILATSLCCPAGTPACRAIFDWLPTALIMLCLPAISLLRACR